MKTTLEIETSTKTIALLLAEAENKYEKAIAANDKEKMRLYFLDRSLMKARLNVLSWITENRGLPI